MSCHGLKALIASDWMERLRARENYKEIKLQAFNDRKRHTETV